MGGALKLIAEVAAFLVLAGAAHAVLNRARGRSSFGISMLVVLVLVAAGLAAAGLAVSSRRALDTYRSYAPLGNDERLASAAVSITSRLSRLSAGAGTPAQRPPTWLMFTEWLRSRIPPDATFQIVSPHDLTQSLFSYWVDWRLLPRIEVDQPERADWTVFFDSTPSAPLKDAIVFAPGFAVARNAGGA